MAFDSLHDFLERLEVVGELKRIARPVATELEITEVADREMKRAGGGKALLFEKPTVNGKASPFPLAINTLGSYKRMALSLGADSLEAVAAELGSLIQAKPPSSFSDALKLLATAFDLRHAKPKLVKTGPCKEVITKINAADTRSTPWPPAPTIEELSRLFASDSSNLSLSNAATLLNLPIQQCWPLDGGRFVTLPCVVTKDPASNALLETDGAACFDMR